MNDFRLLSLLVAFLSGAGSACLATESQVSFPEGAYEVAVKTVLPNLEENLRYATTHKQQCMETQSATRLFPVLEHTSLDGCVLVGDNTSTLKLHFNVECHNPEAASGVAIVTVESQQFRATLDLTMGGKNMRFTQIVSGSRTGACLQQ